MKVIIVNDVKFRVHPVYENYAAPKSGQVINVKKRKLLKGTASHDGRLKISVYDDDAVHKRYTTNRFVWKCYNGLIPEGKVIFYINKNKSDDRLCNLQMTTADRLMKDSNRDYSNNRYNFKNKKNVKAVNCTTNDVSCHKSIYAAGTYLGVNTGCIKMICDKEYGQKTSQSKVNGCSYRFEYISWLNE